MSKRRAVIITADDFGLLPEINDAVIAGYDTGILSSASLRVTSSASHSAAIAASMRPGLAVGLHLVLCDGKATLARRHIPNLVDSTGRFVPRPLEAAWLYRRRSALRDELKAEIRAQIERFMSTGLNLSHISGHYYLHLHPTIVEVLGELASEYPFPAIRSPSGRMLRHERRVSLPPLKGRLEMLALGRVVGRGARRAQSFVGPDRVEMLSPVRPTTEEGIVARLGRVAAGVTELVCHPGSHDSRYDGVGEAAVITSPRVRAAVAEMDLEVISYQELVEDF